MSARAIEHRIIYHRGEGRKLTDPEEGYDEPSSGARRTNLTPRTPRVNRRTPKKVIFARNKKGCFSSSESSAEEDTPSKKPKVKSVGSNVSDPICLDSDDTLAVGGRARAARDMASRSGSAVKVEREDRRIKRQPVTPPPTFSAPSRSPLYASVSARAPGARGPFQYVDHGDDNDIFVDQKREDDDMDYAGLGDYFQTRLEAFGSL